MIFGGGCSIDGFEWESEYGGGPDLLASFPWFFIREVGTAGEEQVVVGDAGKTAGEAFGVRDGGQSQQCERGCCGDECMQGREPCEREQGDSGEDVFHGERLPLISQWSEAGRARLSESAAPDGILRPWELKRAQILGIQFRAFRSR